MKTAAILILLCVHDSQNKDLVVGTILNNTLTYMEMAYNKAVPLSPREDDFHFVDPAQQNIKGIKIQDLDETDVDIANITAGGVGYHYVDISLESEPGSSLNYQIEIYS